MILYRIEKVIAVCFDDVSDNRGSYVFGLPLLLYAS